MSAPLEPPSHTTSDLVVADVPRELPDDWDDAFAWSYGPRYWNIGCG